MKIFADDVAMYCLVLSPNDSRAFQHDLDLVSTWCSKWEMHLNPSKCKLLCITNKCFPVNLLTALITITFSGFLLLSTSVLWWLLSYLGMIVSHMFLPKWPKPWIYCVVICTIAKLIQSRRLLKHLFYLYYIDYASAVWNPYTQENILALEKIQNGGGACWVYGSRFNPHTSTWSKSSSDCYHELHWPSLSTRWKYLSIMTIIILHVPSSHFFIIFKLLHLLHFSTRLHPFHYVNIPPLMHIDIAFSVELYVYHLVSLQYPTIPVLSVL